MKKELSEKVKYWVRTKDIATAWEICQLLADKLDMEEELKDPLCRGEE